MFFVYLKYEFHYLTASLRNVYFLILAEIPMKDFGSYPVD